MTDVASGDPHSDDPPDSASLAACPRCATVNPELARFCAACGTDLAGPPDIGRVRRGRNYAVHPSEPVHSVSILSTVMPHLGGSRRHAYRFVVSLAALAPIVAAAAGYLGFAVVAAAVLIPLVYVVYLHDADVWERESVAVILLAVVASAVLGTLATLAWREWWFDWVRIPLNLTVGKVDSRELLVIGVLAPVVGVLLMQVGPLVLGRREKFNHLLDGLSFGVASGAAYAAAETIVANHSLIGSFSSGVTSSSAGTWVTLIVTAAVIRPLFFGAIIGLTLAEFVGPGEAIGRFSPRYLRAVAEAVVAAVAFAVGTYLFGLARGVEGALLGALYGAVLLALVVVRLRVRLHDALLDEAIEALDAGRSAPEHAPLREHCTNCHTPIVPGAHFCLSCGQAVLASTKFVRSQSPVVAS